MAMHAGFEHELSAIVAAHGGGGGGGVDRSSRAHAAERLVRTGSGGSLEWHGVGLASRFQPVFAVRESSCHGYEALLSATDRDGRTLDSSELFARSVANERPALDWACRALHLRNYAKFDPDERTLFLNVHPQDVVHDAGWARELGELVRYYGLLPKRVCVEILAGECGDDRLLREAVAVYRGLGLGIAIDDFGRGRSNFDRVLELSPDVVKIDRSLLAEAVLGWGRARRMLRGMIELLHDARARVVVGGIESGTEACVAVDAGADFLQGYYLCAPDPGVADERAALDCLAAVLRGAGGRSLAFAT
jgi:EAL domain-containing protein (putative c-di-GMP-specific phosphodiesterase class I)